MENKCFKCNKIFENRILIYNHICENENFSRSSNFSNYSKYYLNNNFWDIENISNNQNSILNFNNNETLINCKICNMNININDFILHVESFHDNISMSNFLSLNFNSINYSENSISDSFTYSEIPSNITNIELSSISISYLSQISNGNSFFSLYSDWLNINLNQLNSDLFLNLMYYFIVFNSNLDLIRSNDTILNFYNLDETKNMLREEINRIPTTKFKNENIKICNICLNNFILNDTLRKLNCNHKFHLNCIDTWLLQNSTCPLCRKDQLIN